VRFVCPKKYSKPKCIRQVSQSRDAAMIYGSVVPSRTMSVKAARGP
jgi:hypothetical protein